MIRHWGLSTLLPKMTQAADFSRAPPRPRGCFRLRVVGLIKPVSQPIGENSRLERMTGSLPSLSAEATRSAIVRLSRIWYCVRMNSVSEFSTGLMFPLSTTFATLRSICRRTVAV